VRIAKIEAKHSLVSQKLWQNNGGNKMELSEQLINIGWWMTKYITIPIILIWGMIFLIRRKQWIK
jgi:hypothetical protein